MRKNMLALVALTVPSVQETEPSHVPVELRHDGDCIVATAEGYVALFDEDAVAVRSRRDTKLIGGRVELRLSSVGRRSDSVPAPPVLERRVEDDVVRYARGWLEESYELRPAGLKQSFIFPHLPAGEGDLVVRLAVTSDLPLEHADAREVRFARPGAGLRIQGVVGIGAAGRRVAGEMRYEEGILELSLPEAFVDGAALPLVLDPLIGPVSSIASFARKLPSNPNILPHPDVAYLPGADLYCAVWMHNDGQIETPYKTAGQLIAPDGTNVGPPLAFTSNSSARPPVGAYDIHLAAVRGAQRFVVAQCGGLLGYSGYFTSVDPLGQVAAPAVSLGRCGAIDVAGDVTLADDDALVVISRSSDGIRVHEVDVATRQTQQTLQLTPGGQGEDRVTITPTGGAPGRYLITWEQGLYPTPHDIWGAVIDRDLSVLAPPFPIATAAADETEPEVDGDGTSWVVAFERAGPQGDTDVVCQGVSYGPLTGSVVLGAERVIAGTPGVDERDPAIAWMGESYLVAYSRISPTMGSDTYVTSVESIGCTECEGEFTLSATGFEEEGPKVASQRSAGSDGETAMLVWVTITDQQSTIGTLKVAHAEQRFFTATDGRLRSKGGACGQGGRADATCALAGAGALGLRLRGARPDSAVRLVIGVQPSRLACPPCILLPEPLLSWGTRTNALGEAALSIQLPPQLALAGQRLLAQWLVRAPGGCGGPGTGTDAFSLSNGIEILVQ